ncbi:type III secretion system effector protein XopR [Xanthomonas campestris]|uniref:type III secretion system effector protein XopR n=1 Tax=Xanthomonas campestris TaxID=339 RepID=UPI0031B8A80A
MGRTVAGGAGNCGDRLGDAFGLTKAFGWRDYGSQLAVEGTVALATMQANEPRECVMRLSQLFSGRHRVAPEPHSPNSTDTTLSTPDASPQHPLSHAPKSTAAQGASTSHRGMVASARRSLASLRKQLPLTRMGSATLAAVESPAAHMPAVKPSRTQQMHGRQARVDEHRQPDRTEHVQRPQPQQAPSARQVGRGPLHPARAQQPRGSQRPVDHGMQPPIPPRMRRDEGQPSHSVPTTPRPSQSSLSSPGVQPGRSHSLTHLNRQLDELNRQCSVIQKRLFMEDREATPEEQQILEARAALIARRNEVRDSQLDALLVALAPMEDVYPPQTTTSHLAIVQQDVMQYNRREAFKVRNKSFDRAAMAKNYARAERRLEILQKNGAPKDKVRRLQRMMQGYRNMLALEQIVKSTDDQLESQGKPRLMSSIPTTADQRQKRLEEERNRHQEQLDNGYL